MNKLSALSKLAKAHITLAADRNGLTIGDVLALEIIEDKFGHIRRSLRIADLIPDSTIAIEGMNPSGPRFL